jgi:N-acetylmuramoyl-L-alanine amidase
MGTVKRGRRQFLYRVLQWGGGTSLLLLAPGVSAGGTVTVRSVRAAHDGARTRLVFDLSAPVDHKLFTLEDPERVVIDLRHARLQAEMDDEGLRSGMLRRIRHGTRNGDDLRVVLDLREKAQPKSFLLPPAQGSMHRLVIDLHSSGEARAPIVAQLSEPRHGRNLVVAIDPGHGGRDPGAVGRGGTKEKDVALAVGRKLHRVLERRPGIEPVMTRDSDRLIKLRDRVRIARQAKADLFVSIHADALDNSRVSGASVYALSLSGASSEMARQLAAKENAVDLIGGVSLRDKDEQLASVLLDLSQTATIQSSLELGEDVLSELGKIGKLNRKDVQQAGFAVLKAPDVPSILVETSFISNPAEERKLRNPRHQQQLAEAIAGGIERYFRRKAPPGTLWANDTYIIRPGDTLSGIAAEHNVSVSQIKAVNHLTTDAVRAGQVLKIPRG